MVYNINPLHISGDQSLAGTPYQFTHMLPLGCFPRGHLKRLM